jgi:hypothetical protein
MKKMKKCGHDKFEEDLFLSLMKKQLESEDPGIDSDVSYHYIFKCFCEHVYIRERDNSNINCFSYYRF